MEEPSLLFESCLSRYVFTWVPNMCKLSNLQAQLSTLPSEPVIASKKPLKVDLVGGKRYSWCTCGHSKKQVSSIIMPVTCQSKAFKWYEHWWEDNHVYHLMLTLSQPVIYNNIN